MQCTIERAEESEARRCSLARSSPAELRARGRKDRAAGEFSDAVIQLPFLLRQFFYSSDWIGDQFIRGKEVSAIRLTNEVLAPFSSGGAPDTPAAFHVYRPEHKYERTVKFAVGNFPGDLLIQWFAIPCRHWNSY